MKDFCKGFVMGGGMVLGIAVAIVLVAATLHTVAYFLFGF
jgi:hypothetical protein